MTASLQRWWEPVVDVLFPPSCGACGASQVHLCLLCDACAHGAAHLGPACCPTCGLPGADERCRDCAELASRGGCGFDRARSLYVYAGPVEQAVHRAKFGDRPHLAIAAGRALAEAFAAGTLGPQADLPELVVPLPVGRQRLADRGYDQALLLARELARCLGRPLLTQSLRRVRETAPQATLDREARPGNVAGAFAVVAPPGRRSVLLVDDVLTTGHTASAAAHVLKAAGASRVEVWTLARATLGASAVAG